jgi:hypothetical protein
MALDITDDAEQCPEAFDASVSTLNVRSILAVHVAKGRECNVSLFRACIGRWTIAALCSRPAPAVSPRVLSLESGVLTRVALAVLAILR